MKKIILCAVVAMLALGSNAQILSSRTLEKGKSNTEWIVRLGMSINTLTGEGFKDVGSTVGYDFSLGFNKPIASSAAYWGMDLGLGTIGASMKYGKETIKALGYNVKFTPLNFGYKYEIGDFKVDPHVGAFLGYAFAHNDNFKGTNSDFDAGIQVGVGGWYKKVNLDVTYQKGFVNQYEKVGKTSAVLIRLGYAF